jgi:hypothetical protein
MKLVDDFSSKNNETLSTAKTTPYEIEISPQAKMLT